MCKSTQEKHSRILRYVFLLCAGTRNLTSSIAAYTAAERNTMTDLGNNKLGQKVDDGISTIPRPNDTMQYDLGSAEEEDDDAHQRAAALVMASSVVINFLGRNVRFIGISLKFHLQVALLSLGSMKLIGCQYNLCILI